MAAVLKVCRVNNKYNHMENKLVKTITLFFLFFVLLSCKAQLTVPLNTGWYTSPTGTYFKDFNNELDQFAGTWKANYGDKTITLVITKELQQQFEDINKIFYRDLLRVRYQVSNIGGLVIHSTLNNNFTSNKYFDFTSLFIRSSTNEVTLLYNGGDCSIGLGTVYFKKINAIQFQWDYKPQGVTLNDINCPPPIDHTIYLPEVPNLIFTKQ